jgi:hypothetical protein
MSLHMPPPRAFWLSASLALLLISSSVAYFFLVLLPGRERHRDELGADLATKQSIQKQVLECADQARLTTQDFGKYATGFGPPPSVSGSSNHYNQKLGKCIVDLQTVDKNGTAEFVLDAYEQSDIIWCNTRFVSKQTPPMQRVCMDHQNKRIDPEEADKQIDALLRE